MSTSKLVALRDFSDNTKKGRRVQYLEQETGRLYADKEGAKFVRSITPVDFICADKAGNPVKDDNGQIIPLSALSDEAARYYYGKMANSTGQKATVEMSTPREDGRLVTMDLAPSDVHVASTLGIFMGGYSIEDGIADAMSPPILVPHEQDVYFTWNATSDFNRKIPNVAGVGGTVPMVNPSLTPTTYATVPYALGGFIPTEVQSNADTPIRPYAKLVQMVVDGLRLEREIRVATQLQTSANWNSNMVTTIAAGAQWDGGGAADPLANLHHQMEQSLKPVTAVGMSELVFHDFVRSPAIQKYIQYKQSVGAVPSLGGISMEFGLPKIIVGAMKYFVGGAPTYVWGNNVVLIRQPSEMPPTSGMDNTSAMTFRWSGLAAGDNKVPDGSVTGGLLVRSYFDQRRGPRGSTVVVVTHNDFEAQTSGLLGGLLIACHQ